MVDESVFGHADPTPPAMVVQENCYDSPNKTVVVVGLPLGGTSAVAGVVDAIGIPLARGEGDIPLRNFEHGQLVFGGVNDVPEVIRGIDARLSVWGLKNPHLRYFDPRYFHKMLRNPYYIVVTKDVASMAIRWATADSKALREALAHQAQQSAQLFSWVLSLPPAPMLLVSYPKLLSMPAEAVRIVAQFCGIPLTDALLQRAVARVSPTGGYLISEANGSE